MPLLSDSAARPIPAAAALRLLKGLVDDPASVALGLGAMFIKVDAISAEKFGNGIVHGAFDPVPKASASAEWKHRRSDAGSEQRGLPDPEPAANMRLERCLSAVGVDCQSWIDACLADQHRTGDS